MQTQPYYGCGGGCRNCPRRRSCAAKAMAAMAVEPSGGSGSTSGSVWIDNQEATGLAEFLAENSGTGMLRIQAFRADQAVPIPNVKITISKELDGKPQVFFQGVTNASGVLDGITLPAPPRSESQEPGQEDPYATYLLRAELAPFTTLEVPVDIFQGVKTVQPVQLYLGRG